MSSSGEDSETAEWEREQMQRGTQSRHQKGQQPIKKTEETKDAIDANVVKKTVSEDIERAEISISSIKKNIGSTEVEIAKSQKRIDAIKKHVEDLEASNSIFEELGELDEKDDILDFVKKYRHIIAKLPRDQREMINQLEERIKESQSVMDVD